MSVTVESEASLEKEMAPHSSILAWKIPWTKKTGGLLSVGHKESDTTERLHFHFHSGIPTTDIFLVYHSTYTVALHPPPFRKR